MSRIGRAPITIPDKVTVQPKNDVVEVAGPLGKLSQKLPPGIRVKVEKNQAVVERAEGTLPSLHGLARSLLSNAITGVTAGFKKDLEIVGLGYRAATTPFPDPEHKRPPIMKRGFLSGPDNNRVFFQLGFAHDIEFRLPAGIKMTIDQKQTALSVTGVDAALVGEVAAQVRSLKKPEPYKLSGIRYVGEHIIKKAGKAAAGAVGGGAAGGAKK